MERLRVIRNTTGGIFPSRQVLNGQHDASSLLALLGGLEVQGPTEAEGPSDPLITYATSKARFDKKYRSKQYLLDVSNMWDDADRVVDYYTADARLRTPGYAQKFSNYQLWESTSLQNTLMSVVKSSKTAADDLYRKHPAARPAYVSLSKELYSHLSSLLETEKEISVLDIAAYGDRAIAASALDMNYTGIDPDPNLRMGHARLALDLLRLSWKPPVFLPFTIEGFYPYSKVNIVTISPPPYDMELYNGELQSHTMYSSFDDWVSGFLTETILRANTALEDGGIFAVTMLDRVGEHKISYTEKFLDMISVNGFKYLHVLWFKSGTPWWIFRKKSEPKPPKIGKLNALGQFIYSQMNASILNMVNARITSLGGEPVTSISDVKSSGLKGEDLESVLESEYLLRNNEGSYEIAASGVSELTDAMDRMMYWITTTATYALFRNTNTLTFPSKVLPDLHRLLRMICLAAPFETRESMDSQTIISSVPEKSFLKEEYLRLYMHRYLQNLVVDKKDPNFKTTDDVSKWLMKALSSGEDVTPDDPMFPSNLPKDYPDPFRGVKFMEGVTGLIGLYAMASDWMLTTVKTPEYIDANPGVYPKDVIDKYGFGNHITEFHPTTPVLLRYDALGDFGHQLSRPLSRTQALKNSLTKDIGLIDIFASRYNAGTVKYYSLFPDIEDGSLGRWTPESATTALSAGGAFMANPPANDSLEYIRTITSNIVPTKPTVIFYGLTVWDDVKAGLTSIKATPGDKERKVVDEIFSNGMFIGGYVLDQKTYPTTNMNTGETLPNVRPHAYSVCLILTTDPTLVDMESLKVLGTVFGKDGLVTKMKQAPARRSAPKR